MELLDFVIEWFRYASNDLISAKHLFEDLYPKQIDISCYHCQQCAEKALKGYLVFKGIEPPRIHNLQTLCKMCMEQDSSFDGIYDFCTLLTKYSTATRYPKELETDEASAKMALERAKQVYDFCSAKIFPQDDTKEGRGVCDRNH